MTNTTLNSGIPDILRTATQALTHVTHHSPYLHLDEDEVVKCTPIPSARAALAELLRLTTSPSSTGKSHNLMDAAFSPLLAVDNEQTQTRLHALITKARRASRERDLPITHIAFGLVKCTSIDRTGAPREIRAPMLLLPVVLKASKTTATFRVERHGDTRYNPALEWLLQEAAHNERNSTLGKHVRQNESARKNDGHASDTSLLTAALQTFASHISTTLPNAVIDRDAVAIGNFGVDYDSIIADISAIAEIIKHTPQTAGSLQLLDPKPPATPSQPVFQHFRALFGRSTINQSRQQYLLLESDSSQRAVIQQVIDGASVCIQGPPGTGKSQTIANLITTLLAHNKRVLFVAQKRTALNAVIDNLEPVSASAFVISTNVARKTVAAALDAHKKQPVPKTATASVPPNPRSGRQTERALASLQQIYPTVPRSQQADRAKLTEQLNATFRPDNTDLTLMWENRINALVLQPQSKDLQPQSCKKRVETFGIYGFWHWWGYWYSRWFLTQDRWDSVEPILSGLSTSGDPQARIRSLPFGLQGLVGHLMQTEDATDQLHALVRYHIQRLYIRRAARRQQRALEHLRGALRHTPQLETSANGKSFDPSVQHAVLTATREHCTQAQSPAAYPCVIATPEDVVRFVSLDDPKFDVVVIDEASQIRPELIIGVLFRAHQCAVFGDLKQLPPTQFGVTALTDSDDVPPALADFYNKTGESALAWLSNLPTIHKHMLAFFYRGPEQLIAANNMHFYHGEIHTFPKPQFDAVTHHLVPIADDKAHTDAAIFHTVLSLYKAAISSSVLIIASGDTRRKALLDYAKRHDHLIENDHVTAIESVQGDEADTVICFFDHPEIRPDGNINLVALGPMNLRGGERRLNVAFSRAKKHMHLVTSFRADQIQPTPDGVAQKFLKSFIDLANNPDAISTARGTKHRVEPWEQHFAGVLNARIGTVDVHHSYGQSRHPLTWVIRSHGTMNYTHTYDTDYGRYCARPFDMRDERIRQKQLEKHGWKGSTTQIQLIACLETLSHVEKQIYPQPKKKSQKSS